ncbi:MAG: hypothetical protein J1F31_05180 [Erysipelotrichales bacterium]|nr:hypothetical protein [Erysipelotrichales bacterium]
MKVNIKVNNHELTATLVNNSSTKALIELLSNGPIEVNTSDYGDFEKVGSLPKTLPRNDTNINTEPGDIILYQGNSICFYYGYNSWNFTRLGKIDNVDSMNLKEVYGPGNVKFVLSI